MRIESRSVVGVLALVGCLLISAVASTAWAGFDKKGTLSADSLVLRNLIGEIEILGHGRRAMSSSTQTPVAAPAMAKNSATSYTTTIRVTTTTI